LLPGVLSGPSRLAGGRRGSPSEAGLAPVSGSLRHRAGTHRVQWFRIIVASPFGPGAVIKAQKLTRTSFSATGQASLQFELMMPRHTFSGHPPGLVFFCRHLFKRAVNDGGAAKLRPFRPCSHRQVTSAFVVDRPWRGAGVLPTCPGHRCARRPARPCARWWPVVGTHNLPPKL